MQSSDEFDAITQVAQKLVGDFDNIEGNNITELEEPDLKSEEELKQIADAAYEKSLKEGYDPHNDPDIDKPKPKPKRRITHNKDRVASLVANADLLGYTGIEAAQFITRNLYPSGDGEFTKHQYTTWINKLKFTKLQHVDYYSRSGLFEDVYDIRERSKVTAQLLFRQYRRECVKPDGEQDKGYIIKLSAEIRAWAEQQMKIALSIPYIQNLKILIEATVQREHELRKNYPAIFEVSRAGSIGTVLPKAGGSESGDGGFGEAIAPKALDEKPEGQESITGSGEGAIQGDTDNGAVPPANRAARAESPERVF